jgi:hypothetical protein
MPVKQLWVVIVLVLSSVPGAHADVITVGASKDNSLLEDPNGAFSGGASSAFFLGRLGTNGNTLKRRGAIAFDLSSIPSNAVITNVSMTLTLLRGSGGSTPVELHAFTKNWGEGTSLGGPQGGASSAGDATWIHTFFPGATWTNPGGDFDAAVSGVQNVDFTGPVTWQSTGQMVADVQRWVRNADSNFGWVMIGDEVNISTAKEFTSKEGFSGQPALTVTFSVPEPRIIGALGIVILSALGARGSRLRHGR